MTSRRAEYCAIAIADCFADDGEIMGSPMGLLPSLGARLAKLTSNPLLMITDGEARILQGAPPLGVTQDVVEGWMPFRLVLEAVVPYGKRHVMMGATQIDREGNQNISAIGDWAQPKRQLLGVRGAPGNTVNNKTSYWVPKHSPRVFVEQVDVVSGVGRTRAEAAGPAATRFHGVHRVVSNLGVFDFGGPDHTMRFVSVHPGRHGRGGAGSVLVRDCAAGSWGDGDVPTTREPSPGELMLIREMLDPKTLRDREVPPVIRRGEPVIEQLLRTPLTELAGVRHPVVQTGMGWVAGPRLVVGTANAGGLGILASATMTIEELEHAILEVKGRTDQPFGVNLRADAADAPDRVDLLIKHGVKVASFALAPKKELIAKLKDHGIVVMPSVGAARHAEKVAGWGADAVMIQGGEGGGHTGTVPTTLLLPTVLDAVDIPVVAAGGFFDGRGLAAALSYGAAGVGMGTRFLLTQDSTVPDAVKQRYLEADLNGTVVTAKVDGMPHRMLRTDLVEQVEETSALRRLGPTARRTLEFKQMSGMSWRQLAVDGRAMRKEQGRTLAQMTLAANTPMMLKAGLVEGDTDAGVLASGQVVGVIDDLPTCEELLDRVVTEAAELPPAYFPPAHLSQSASLLRPPTEPHVTVGHSTRSEGVVVCSVMVPGAEKYAVLQVGAATFGPGPAPVD